MVSVTPVTFNSDLFNTPVIHAVKLPPRDSSFACASLTIPPENDDPNIRSKHRPLLNTESIQATDWVSRLELATVSKMTYNDINTTGFTLKVLILFGSLRKRS